MSEASGAAADYKKNPGNWRMRFFHAIWVILLAGCSSGFESEPLVEYSTELTVQGATPQTLTRQLREGVYLLEIRERDIDLRVGVDAGTMHTELGDAFLRHGVHRTVVSLSSPAAVKLTLNSMDQRSWRGSAAVRILRFPASPDETPTDQRVLGFMALGKSSALIAKTDPKSWREAVQPLREAASLFQASRDEQSEAEAEYQLAWLQFYLLYDNEDARRSAESAQQHFKAVGDDTGMYRAAMLRGLTEFSLASSMAPDVPRSEQMALLDRATARFLPARKYFAEHELHTDEIDALNRQAIRPQILGDYDACSKIYEEALALSRKRHDPFYEAGFASNLGYVASRKGQMLRAKTLFERALPMIDRERNPDLHATIVGNLGHALVALGEFDRALLLHSEALDVFKSRGDDSQTARELSALASIQFRSGNVERALATIESALPLYEKSRDYLGKVSSLRMAGNAAAELDQHDIALEYLRRAERDDKNGITVERTRVLIAGQLRELGDLAGAEKMLTPLLNTRFEPARADALAERSRLRQRQHRAREALADLRAADAIYDQMRMDFDRIDTSSALAMALLAAGDIPGARAAADAAIGIETRIRVSSANPEVRARFLSASYAPYEARIETELAAAANDKDAVWKAFRVAEGLRARSLADRLAHVTKRDAAPRDEQLDRLRETMTALQMDLEKHLRRGLGVDKESLDTRRLIDETRARIEARQVTQLAGLARSDLIIPESLPAMQAALPDDTAVLAYFVGDQRSHAWLLTRTELRHGTLPGRRSLEGLVNSFIAQQRAGVIGQQDPAMAPLLGKLLDGVHSRRLLVLPDGPLNSLPFAALGAPQGGPREQLIDRFVISAAPSLALAMRPVSVPDDHEMRVAVISDPVYTADDRRLNVAATTVSNYRGSDVVSGRMARLPYSAIEARAVVRAFEGSDVIELAGFNATARRVIDLPSDTLDVLHFATHAVTSRDAPEQSALFLSEYAADGTRLPSDRLTADDIARSGLRADIVVLSGCATGDGRELRGEGVLGLTYGFLANGSHTVIASLWPVEDALTARFMEEFYAAYRVSGSAAGALRAAQLRVRGTAAAAVWSSFVVRSNTLP